MAKGKQTCKILKEIRKQIAAENDIDLVVSECTYQGDCLGTCPKCEAEVRYLERELEKRQRLGKAAVFAGMSMGTLFAATGCHIVQPLAGMPADAFDGKKAVTSDTIPEQPLAGDVVAVMPLEPLKPVAQVAPPDTIPSDTIIQEPLMGLVEMYHAMFPFDAEVYQKQLKEHFVFRGSKNLSVVSGEIVYQYVGDEAPYCSTLEEMIKVVKEFRAPSYYREDEQLLLREIAIRLQDKGVDAGKFSGNMEVAFLVDDFGKLHNVKVVKGINKSLDAAVADVFEQTIWNAASYSLKDGSLSNSFECNCVQKIHFPIKITNK